MENCAMGRCRIEMPFYSATGCLLASAIGPNFYVSVILVTEILFANKGQPKQAQGGLKSAYHVPFYICYCYSVLKIGHKNLSQFSGLFTDAFSIALGQ